MRLRAPRKSSFHAIAVGLAARFAAAGPCVAASSGAAAGSPHPGAVSVAASSAAFTQGAASSTSTMHIPTRPSAAAAPGTAESGPSQARKLLSQGHEAYYRGEPRKAISRYEKAIAAAGREKKDAQAALEARLNGALVWGELGRPEQASQWLRAAVELSSTDAKAYVALGWAELHGRRLKRAEGNFLRALALNRGELYALLGLGRAESALGRHAEAIDHLARAAAAAPLNNLAHFWKAQAEEAAGNVEGAIESYKQAALNDSYFVEARYALGRAYMRKGLFNDAAVQLSKALNADPGNSVMLRLRARIRRFTRNIREASRGAPAPPAGPPAPSAGAAAGGTPTPQEKPGAQRPAFAPTPEARGTPPKLRVGIGTSALGKPLPRRALEFRYSVPFSVVDPKSGKTLASGLPGQMWQARFLYRRKRPAIELADVKRKRPALSARAFLLRPASADGIALLHEIPYARGSLWSGVANKPLRGEIELSLHPGRRAFKVVNVVDLESYTHGVLSAEMPVQSPTEALKAQSVVARSHALYIQNVTRRHRGHGYDVCDGQHCQVYSGVAAETERSRRIVDSTRARIIAYRGKVAHVLYSSNCGGHTQSGSELSGWGDLHYWRGTQDAPPGAPAYPSSPWELFWWLRSVPASYCMAAESGRVYPAHYRWTRVVPARDLEEKINRKSKIGKLLGLRALRRARSGHLNSVLLLGGRKNLKISQEIQIRSLLGIGSQRSALFTVETEIGPDKRPAAFVLHGAGWGHGVGMCQSGAIGRAESGQSYMDILQAYYRDTEFGSLMY